MLTKFKGPYHSIFRLLYSHDASSWLRSWLLRQQRTTSLRMWSPWLLQRQLEDFILNTRIARFWAKSQSQSQSQSQSWPRQTTQLHWLEWWWPLRSRNTWHIGLEGGRRIVREGAGIVKNNFQPQQSPTTHDLQPQQPPTITTFNFLLPTFNLLTTTAPYLKSYIQLELRISSDSLAFPLYTFGFSKLTNLWSAPRHTTDRC